MSELPDPKRTVDERKKKVWRLNDTREKGTRLARRQERKREAEKEKEWRGRRVESQR